MTLSQWIKKERVSLADVAKKLKLGAPWSVSRYLGKSARLPAPEVIRSVYKLTRGAVTPNDFYKLGKREAVAK